jgi:phospholipid/cholesterol/gamma-HCH transport system substrate-binding protein
MTRPSHDSGVRGPGDGRRAAWRTRLRTRAPRRQRISKRAAGLIGIVVVIAVSYGVYTKFANPFASPFTIHAIFPDANELNIDSLVRIAGVNVGKVTSISFPSGCSRSDLSACNAADVTMQIQPDGLPLHDDATFEIRPRIFLEGNFFVQVDPGTPSSPIAADNHTFPIQQGSDPVQLDQILDTLPRYTRQNLQVLLQQYGKGIDESASSFNASIQYWEAAYKNTAIVSHAALGIGPSDLATFIAKQGSVSGSLSEHPDDLESLITRLELTAHAFARQNSALAAAVGELPRTLAAATPSLQQLDSALGPLERLSRDLVPGVRSAGPTITASLPFIAQLRKLVEPSELRGLTAELSPTIPALAKLTKETIPLMAKGVRPLSSCVANVIYPWSKLTLNDGTFSGKPGFPLRPVYVEAVDYLPGLAGESRDLDANGPYIRVLLTGGALTYSLAPGLFGQALAPIDSVQPQLPPGGRRPPLRPNVPCETQAPISSLYAPPGPPISPLASDSSLSSPGAALRWKSAARAALDYLTGQAKQQGLAVKVSHTVREMLR